MFTPLQVPYAQHITLPVCTYENLAHTKRFWKMGRIRFSTLCLGWLLD